jgi:hypothetical protein
MAFDYGQMIIQVWISTHFGVISERLLAVDEKTLFIGSKFYLPPR